MKTVNQIAKQTGISPTTLYSIIQKDSNLRFDWALRIANILEIEVDEICEANPFSGKISVDEIYPTLGEFNGRLDASRVRGYLKSSILPLMHMYGPNGMPDVDNLLTSFYQLNDEARNEIVEMIKVKLKYQRDPQRADDIKSIKGW